jgi:hypothetical protein
MQVKPTENVALPAAQSNAVATVRVLAGNLGLIPTGALLRATVARLSPGEAVLTVNGQALTVRPATGLQLGSVLLVRAPLVGGTPGQTLDLLGRATDSPAPALPTSTGQSAQSSPAAAASRQAQANTTQSASAPPPTAPAGNQPVRPLPLANVEVLAVLPDGRVRVQVDGQDEIATTSERLAAGGRYVMQVERTGSGLTLGSPSDRPDLTAALAGSILRGTLPPDIAAAIKPLLAELAALQKGGEASKADQEPLEKAAATVQNILETFLASGPNGRPLNSAELQNLVDHGGLHYEAKLARLFAAADPDAAEKPDDSRSAEASRAAGTDLKGALLRLLQAAQEFGVQLPAARTTLAGIESQQAANVLAQDEGTPYILQVPFPDAGQWRTLHLSVEPDGGGTNQKEPGGNSGFRLLMHIPLAELGETWIDAGSMGNSFRAVLYLDNVTAREQVRQELPELRSELLRGDFQEVLLDVRSTSELPAQRRKQGTAMLAGRTGTTSVLDVRA